MSDSLSQNEPALVARPSLWGWFVRAGRKILTERASPARLGWAVGLGVLIGCSPFIGLHLMIVIVVATVLGLNRAVTYLAANISVPWMQPLLLFLSVQLGTLVLHGHFLPMSMEAVRAIEPVDFGLSWLLGAFLLGMFIGAPAGWITYLGLSRYRRRHPLPADPVADALEETARRFARYGRFLHGYVRGKLMGDPLYRQLGGLVPLATPVLDLGCGRGLAAVLLDLLQPGLELRGIDWDAKKIERAKLVAAERPNLRFEIADVRQVALPQAGTVLLLDVLHYSPAAEQDELLRRAARALASGGRLILRDLDDGKSFRARLTRWLERLGRLFAVNRGATLCFRPIREVVALLEAEGLRCEVLPSSGDIPTANVLVVAQKS